MANFIALVDPDPARRQRFIADVAPRVAPFEGLVAGSCDAGPFAVLWAAGESAPISVWRSDGAANGVSAGPGTRASSAAAIIFGTAIGGENGELVDAHELHDSWRDIDRNLPAQLDGYFAALRYDASAGLLVGADILGRFPIYYYSAGDVLLVGSSPELFRHHPSFRKAFDPLGLVGILLTNGLSEGRTLWAGVTRLDSGHLLEARPGQPPREIRQYVQPLSEDYFYLPFEEHLKLVDSVLDRAIKRHVPRSPRSVLMLSGGLDSRTVAGYLHREGISPIAITHGDARDIEVKCATAVARRLGFEHHTHENSTTEDVAQSIQRVNWEQLASGFSGGAGWGRISAQGSLATREVTGHGMDWILGGWEFAQGTPSFETFFSHMNRWGVSPAVLERLLKREVFGDALAQVMTELKSRYESYSDLEYRRAWCFALYHRQRFHIGSLAWAGSFRAWQIWPAVDKHVIGVASALPESSMVGRRLQYELMCTRFPQLARLPLDRNSYNMDPLLPSFAWKARRYVRRRWKRVIKKLGGERAPKVELRRYYRHFDVNGPRWTAIRAQVEPNRELGLEYFDRDALAALVPPPDARPAYQDGIVGPAGMKSVMGFLLWLKRAELG
jgi:asparagine synthase (glutamine-hydrolysing)